VTAALAARLGIFARIFPRSTATEVAEAVAASGYRLAHWNFAAIGRPTLAIDVADAEFDEVRRAFGVAGVSIPSVSATFNAIHPDRTDRQRQALAATRLIAAAPRLGATVVTLCTGTRDADDMWRSHPANADSSAWHDLRETLDPLLVAAAAAGVTLGIEPEPGNVVCDPDAAARLLHELGDDAPVGIVLDPANLLSPETVHRQDEVIGHAVDLLGERVIAAHAKDVAASPGGSTAAGAGLLDYPRVLGQLARLGDVPLIVQDVSEALAAGVRADLLSWWASRPAG
jgi:sugar phosphate isomerase/epimerase